LFCYHHGPTGFPVFLLAGYRITE